MKKQPVPVFMYHSVGVPNIKWKWNYLTTHFEDFEKELIYLRKNNYSTISLDDLYNYINYHKKIPKKSIILTFDDGYVDNYIFAYPLLKKYGFKGTIFINPEFTDPRDIIRKRFDESNKVILEDTTGFLSWQEMRLIEREGVFDIQSHAMTHTWYPISNNIIGFRKNNDENSWMTWNNYPQKKPYLQIENHSLIHLGEPVYENEKSLMARRYFPNQKLKMHLIEFVKNNGGLSFFNQLGWEQILFSFKNKIIDDKKLEDGYYESDLDWKSRIRAELHESKNIIEQKLNKKVEYLCWPGGSATKEGQTIAEEVGYKMTTAARDIDSKLRKKIKNDGVIYGNRIARTSPVVYESNKNGVRKIIYSKGFIMKLRILAFRSYSIKRQLIAGIIIFIGYLNNIFNSNR